MCRCHRSRPQYKRTPVFFRLDGSPPLLHIPHRGGDNFLALPPYCASGGYGILPPWLSEGPMFRAFATDVTLPQTDLGSGKQPDGGVHLPLSRVEGLTWWVLPYTGGCDHGYRESNEVSTACERVSQCSHPGRCDAPESQGFGSEGAPWRRLRCCPRRWVEMRQTTPQDQWHDRGQTRKEEVRSARHMRMVFASPLRAAHARQRRWKVRHR